MTVFNSSIIIYICVLCSVDLAPEKTVVERVKAHELSSTAGNSAFSFGLKISQYLLIRMCDSHLVADVSRV